MSWIRVTTVLLALTAPVAAAVETGQAQDRKRIEQALAAPAAAGYAREIAALAPQRDARALAAALERIADDASLDDTARTALMHDTLVTLAAAEPDPDLHATLEGHVAAPRTVSTWHDDEGHRVAIEIYDTGAAARYALREWRRTGARREATAALARGTIRLEAMAVDTAVRDGYDDAFAAASAAELAPTRAELLHGLASGLPVTRAALTAAARLQDRELADEALARGSAIEVVHAFAGIRTAFPAADAFALLATASRRDDVGAAAVAQIGLLVHEVPAARTWLLDALADRRLGAAAAAALAHDDAAIPRLTEILAGRRGTLAQMRAALTLQLNGSLAARAALEHAVADPLTPASLQRDIAKWLR